MALFDPDTWGTVGQWTSAVATTGALATTLGMISRVVRDRRRSQAAKVALYGTDTLTADVENPEAVPFYFGSAITKSGCSTTATNPSKTDSSTPRPEVFTFQAHSDRVVTRSRPTCPISTASRRSRTELLGHTATHVARPQRERPPTAVRPCCSLESKTRRTRGPCRSHPRSRSRHELG